MEIDDKPAHLEFDNLPFDIITEILLYLDTEDLFQSAFVSRNIRKCAVSSPILKLRDRLFDAALFNVDKQEYDLAIATIGRLLVLFPGDPDALQERAFNYKDKEMIVRGLLDLRTAHKTARDEAHSCFIRAQQHWLKNECQKSYEQIDKAIQLHPKPRYYHFRGFIFSTLSAEKDEKNINAEISDYEFILEHHKEYKRIAVVYNNLAYVCFDQQRYDDAKKYFVISSGMAPHHIRSYYNTALMHAELGEFAAAIDYVKKILTINPQLNEIRALSGWCYSGLNKDDESIEDYAQALLRTYCEPHAVGPSFTVMIYWGRITRALQESETCMRKIYADLERVGKHRRTITELLQGEYKTLNDDLTPQDSSYIDPFIDVNKKEGELKTCLRKISKYRAELYLQLGDISAAAVDYTKFIMLAKEQSSDEKSAFLDMVFTSDILKLSEVSDAARGIVNKYIGNSRRGQIYASVRDNLSADVRLEAMDDIKFYLLGFAYRAFNLVMPFAEEQTLALNIIKRMMTIVEQCYAQKSMKSKAFYFALTFPSLALLLFMKYMENHNESELDQETQVVLLKAFLSYKAHSSMSTFKKDLETTLDRAQ